MPPLSSQQSISSVKTPRPDLSIGLRNGVVVNALQSPELTKIEADDLLESMQGSMAPDGSRPILCSDPTQRALYVRFPFLVVEGESYATGNPVFEAQNRAAVSGACALTILHNLNNLTGKADPESHPETQPIVFSVCTEGPYHELWAHYMTMEDGVRMYNMVMLKTYNAVICDELLRFLIAVDNVIS